MGAVFSEVAPLETDMSLAIHAHYQHIHIVKAAMAVVGKQRSLLLGQRFY